VGSDGKAEEEDEVDWDVDADEEGDGCKVGMDGCCKSVAGGGGGGGGNNPAPFGGASVGRRLNENDGV